MNLTRTFLCTVNTNNECTLSNNIGTWKPKKLMQHSAHQACKWNMQLQQQWNQLPLDAVKLQPLQGTTLYGITRHLTYWVASKVQWCMAGVGLQSICTFEILFNFYRAHKYISSSKYRGHQDM